MKKILLIAAVLFSVQSIFAQQFCTDFHKKNCKLNPDPDYIYNAQSKSGLFEKGQTSSLRIVGYKGVDYYINICTQASLGGKVAFKIKDGKTSEILYDNAADNLSQEFDFSCDNSRTLIIEVTIPGDSSGEKDKKTNKLKDVDMACLGVLIQTRPTPKTGF
jgi:hypothetical protein